MYVVQIDVLDPDAIKTSDAKEVSSIPNYFHLPAAHKNMATSSTLMGVMNCLLYAW